LKIEPVGKTNAFFIKDWVTSQPSATPATPSTASAATPSPAAPASTATPTPPAATTSGGGTSTAARLADITFVGVHVRRTDYKGYLWRTRKMNLADASYFHRAMDHFRAKFAHVAFVVVSDEASWCLENLSADDVLVVRSRITSPGLDLALMASCNHSIIDYGTFGVWGAVLAGGETVLYNISRHSSVRVAQLLPNWHVMD
jgi:Glycosyl transferase family 11